MRTRSLLFAFLAAGAVGLAAPAVTTAPFDNYVDLQLVLAVDVSGSMDGNEQRVQRQGYVDALRDPAVLRAIRSGPYGRIAITYIEWSSAFYQLIVLPWRVLGDDEEVLAFAADLERAPI